MITKVTGLNRYFFHQHCQGYAMKGNEALRINIICKIRDIQFGK